jgi:hypothetical protein
MSKQFPGGLITKTPVTPTSISAPGVWSLSQQAAAQATNTWPFPRDPQFNYVTMLLHGDGSAGGVAATGVGAGVSTTVTNFNADASTNNFNVTINGDARSNNFNPYQSGYYSNYFNGASDYIGFSTITLGSSFTVEFFINIPATVSSNNIVISNAAGGGGTNWIGVDSSNVYFSYAGTTRSFAFVPAAGTWYYVQIIVTGSTVSAYVNGTQVGSTQTGPTSYTVDRIGGYSGNGVYGWLSNVRVTNAANAVSATPTTPLTAITSCVLLTCQSNRFIDNSASPYTLTPAGSTYIAPAQPFTLPSSVSTYGSGYFNGVSSSNQTLTASPTAVGTSNFTVEFWFYYIGVNSDSSDQQIYDTGTNGFSVYISGGSVNVYNRVASASIFSSSAAITAKSWVNIAFVRSGTGASQTVLYVNGTSAATATLSTNFTSTTLSIGGRFAISGASWNSVYGYLSNVRYATTAVYSGNFTPSTTPLTAITNTSLLTTQYNGGGNNSGFKDSGPNNFAITRNGNTTQGTFAPYGSNWSNYFGGAGNYFQTPASSATTIVGTLSSTVNLTIECWIFPTAYNSSANFPGLIGDMVATTENNNWSWGLTNTGTLMLYWNVSGTQYRATSSAAVSLNTWTHIALNVASGSITMYANGVSQTLSGTTTLGTPSSSNGYLVIGQWNNGSGGTGGVSNGLYTGYISNLRVVKASTYTSSFTPSTVPLTAITSTSLLYCQSNRFVDNSSNSLAITLGGSPSVQRFSPFAPSTVYNPTTISGSGYFDGDSGDYLICPPGYLTSIGTGNFTIEGWWSFNDFNTRGVLFQRLWSFGTGLANDVTLNIDNSGSLVYRIDDAIIISASGSLNKYSWNHVALVRSSNVFTIYVNGVSVGTASNSTNFTTRATNNLVIGAESDVSGGWFSGYQASFRVTNIAVYTAAFTPSTSPLTAINGTSLLLNYSNAGILDNAMMNNLETVGNAAVSTSVKKYGAASMVFDGTGDYLVSTSTNNPLAFGTGDFTIEFWLYLNSTGTQVIFDGRNSSASDVAPMIYYLSGLKYYTAGNDRITGGTLSTGQWYYITLVKASGSTKLYINGTQTGSTYTDGNTYVQQVNRPVVGAEGVTLGNSALNGYIDDLRITKYARYTTTFTVPDQAFPNG